MDGMADDGFIAYMMRPYFGKIIDGTEMDDSRWYDGL